MTEYSPEQVSLNLKMKEVAKRWNTESERPCTPSWLYEEERQDHFGRTNNRGRRVTWNDFEKISSGQITQGIIKHFRIIEVSWQKISQKEDRPQSTYKKITQCFRKIRFIMLDFDKYSN